VKIGAQQLGDEVAERRLVGCMEGLPIRGTNMSSRGEMKMSLRLMTYEIESDGLFQREKVFQYTHSRASSASGASTRGRYAWTGQVC
jgi:hypothetical protein